jgi:hypothetical protein
MINFALPEQWDIVFMGFGLWQEQACASGPLDTEKGTDGQKTDSSRGCGFPGSRPGTGT